MFEGFGIPTAKNGKRVLMSILERIIEKIDRDRSIGMTAEYTLTSLRAAANAVLNDTGEIERDFSPRIIKDSQLPSAGNWSGPAVKWFSLMLELKAFSQKST